MVSLNFLFLSIVLSVLVKLIVENTLLISLISSCSVGNVSSGSGLFHVDVIVLDEVHYLSDISRGTVWEEIVSTISYLCLIHSLSYLPLLMLFAQPLQVIYCPKEVQLICLSATVANPDELAGWIGQVLRLGQWSLVSITITECIVLDTWLSKVFADCV